MPKVNEPGSTKATGGTGDAAAPPREVTQLLQAWSEGDSEALDKLTPLVYQELYRRAHRSMVRERPGHTLQTTADEAILVSCEPRADLVALDDALNALAAVDRRKSQVVELRFFGGLNMDEAAEVLKVSPETIKRDWKLAKAWLLRHMSQGEAR
jgi:DNA-directed RNA polymerase specialized sigma24 family protein